MKMNEIKYKAVLGLFYEVLLENRIENFLLRVSFFKDICIVEFKIHNSTFVFKDKIRTCIHTVLNLQLIIRAVAQK